MYTFDLHGNQKSITIRQAYLASTILTVSNIGFTPPSIRKPAFQLWPVLLVEPCTNQRSDGKKNSWILS